MTSLLPINSGCKENDNDQIFPSYDTLHSQLLALTLKSQIASPLYTMLDPDQFQNSPRNHLYRTRHVRSSHDSAEEKEFDFWGAKNTSCWEWEFHSEAHSEEYFVSYSTDTLRMRDIKDESSPLLPHNHHYSNPCPTSQRQTILQSKKELMEMIQDMPESCYELSLRDIVDDQQGVQGKREEIDAEETSLNFQTQPQTRKQKSKKKKSYNTGGKISRTSSMKSEAFLIKIFFPNFLGSKKKAKAPGNCSKVSPGLSLGGAGNHQNWCNIRFSLTGVNRKSNRSSSTGSTSSSNSSTTRLSDSDILPGCWFFHSKKSKSKSQKGYLP